MIFVKDENTFKVLSGSSLDRNICNASDLASESCWERLLTPVCSGSVVYWVQVELLEPARLESKPYTVWLANSELQSSHL